MMDLMQVLAGIGGLLIITSRLCSVFEIWRKWYRTWKYYRQLDKKLKDFGKKT